MYRAGFVGLVGTPNAGKSTLLNILVQEKLSIVTPKAQTTRRRVHGIVNLPEGQIVYVDAPGVVKPGQGLNTFLANEVQDVIESSDALIFVVSVDEMDTDEQKEILSRLADSKKPWFVVLTKIDLKIRGKMDFGAPVVEFSIKSPMVQNLAQEISKEAVKILPENPGPLYGDDILTTHPVREIVGEFIREQCFLNLEQELPYGIAVQILKFDESDPRLTRIDAEILVTKQNHKAMILGKEGSMIKKIGTLARKEIETLLGKKIFLGLNVKVKENWQKDQRVMKELGYELERNRK